jgi:hypothetical protein
VARLTWVVVVKAHSSGWKAAPVRVNDRPPPPPHRKPSPPIPVAPRPRPAAATVEEPIHRPSSTPSRRSKRDEPDLRRAEQLLRSLPNKGRHEGGTCAYCRRRRARQEEEEQEGMAEDEGYGGEEEDVLPPQTVLARALRELEDDFAQHKT